MKLITEMIEDVECIVESSGEDKNYYIEGVFMQAEQKNRNGRVYPKKHISPAVDKYISEYVDQNRALGELNHPSGPTVNLDKVSHIIKELHCDGNNFVGKAKVLDTPMGKIVKNLINEGARLGVSSRGMGSLKKSNGINEVQNDFILSAVDFVNGIMEGKEWIWNNGVLQEQEIAQYERQIKEASRRQLEEKTLNAFKNFISKL